MTLLLHAITTPEALQEAPDGLGGRPLVRVDAADLAAWATWWAEPAEVPRFGRSELLAHHQIVSRLHEQLDACLPARFTTWLTAADALCADLERQRARLRANLDQVRGRCELAVTGVWTAPPRAMPVARPATSGTDYLLARQQALAGSDERREQARALAEEIERMAGADLIAVRRLVCPSTLVALSSALLAPRACASGLMARLPRARDGVRILVNGPWPAYTFATVP